MKPLSIKELKEKQKQNEEGYIIVCVPFELGELIYSDIDMVNDIAEEKICHPDSHAILSDISYEVIGSIKQSIILQVRAQVEFV